MLYYAWPLLCAVALVTVGRRYAHRSEHAADQAEDACHRAFDAADEAEAHATRCAAEHDPDDTTELPPVKTRVRRKLAPADRRTRGYGRRPVDDYAVRQGRANTRGPSAHHLGAHRRPVPGMRQPVILGRRLLRPVPKVDSPILRLRRRDQELPDQWCDCPAGKATL